MYNMVEKTYINGKMALKEKKKIKSEKECKRINESLISKGWKKMKVIETVCSCKYEEDNIMILVYFIKENKEVI